MKKIALITAISFSAFAYQSVDDRLDTLETQMKEVSARNPSETLGAAFVSSRPELSNGTNFFLTFDVIYWHPKMGGTEFAYVANGDSGFGLTFVTPQPNGDMKENDFSWDVGLKVGIGYKTPHDNWDVFARYTWFDSSDSKSIQKNAPAYIFSIKTLTPVASDRAKSHIDIDYNTIELELARSYFLSQHFSVRPHFDVKTTWVDIEEYVTYHYNPAFYGSILNDFDHKVKDSSKFWGMGPRTGVDAKLFIGDGFNLFGEIAASILYGYFKTRHKEIFPSIPGVESEIEGTLYTIRDHFHRFIPYVQMQMGLEWSTYLNDHKQYLSLRMGYEVQYYWRAFQTVRTHELVVDFVDNPNAEEEIQGIRKRFDKISEDLMFYGITGEVRLDF